MAIKKRVNIINESTRVCSFKPYQMASFVRIYPRYSSKMASLPIDVELLKASLSQDIGLQRMFNKGMLAIDDVQIATELGLIEKHELVKTYDEIKELLLSDNKTFETYLNDIMDEDVVERLSSMPEMICTVAREIMCTDLDKLKLIEEYTGYAIKDVIEELQRLKDGVEVKADAKPKKKNNKKTNMFEE